jgi:hypothetical protein
LRQKVWGLHAGGYENSNGGVGDSHAIAKAFADWDKLMNGNAKLVEAGKDLLSGHLVPFKDSREIHYRLG